MNRDALGQELPPQVLAWLAEAHPDTWDAVARDVALRLGRILLSVEGRSRADRAALLVTTTSPALATILPGLPWRSWGAYTVAEALASYFALHGAERDLRRRLAGHVGQTPRPAA